MSYVTSMQTQYNDLLTAAAKGKKGSLWGGKSSEPDSSLTSDVVKLILFEAIAGRASDIHIEPQPNRIRVRYRIDGKLYDVLEVMENADIHLIPHVKILANLPTDTVSSRKAWDGRFSMTI